MKKFYNSPALTLKTLFVEDVVRTSITVDTTGDEKENFLNVGAFNS
ncbi:MAG: hypothetical protein IJX88_05035 [Clostridia bacterium]|nr:hypothetical protein [Clostridia bacterium]